MDGYAGAWGAVGVLLLVGIAFVVVALSANRLLRPAGHRGGAAVEPYECGVVVDPIDRDWAQTHIRYYVYAFLYVVFAVEAVFLYPVGDDLHRPRLRCRRARRDGRLRRPARPRPALRLAEAGADMGLTDSALPDPIKFVLNWGRRYSLWVFNFGLACCAIEFIATSMARHDFIRLGVIPFAHGPRQADLMVVSGTVTDKMAPAIKRLYDQMPEPKYVISFGACSNCGGPYWDSYSVTKGVDQIIPVDVYVPGCPPRPEALLQGILRLQDKIAGEPVVAARRVPRRRPR